MNCIYCQQEMKNLFPTSSSKTVWQCLKCPHEVRISEQENIIKRISIFVHKDDKEYCLHQYADDQEQQAANAKKFDISLVGDIGTVVFSSDMVPDNLAPATAYQKLLTYLIFL